MGLPDARMARLPGPVGPEPAIDSELDHVVSKSSGSRAEGNPIRRVKSETVLH